MEKIILHQHPIHVCTHYCSRLFNSVGHLPLSKNRYLPVGLDDFTKTERICFGSLPPVRIFHLWSAEIYFLTWKFMAEIKIPLKSMALIYQLDLFD